MRGTGGTWFNASKLLIQKDKCGTAFKMLMCPGKNVRLKDEYINKSYIIRNENADFNNIYQR